MLIRVTQQMVDDWRRTWPCSTLTTGTVELDDRNGDLLDLGGRLMVESTVGYVDGYELTAFCDDMLRAMNRPELARLK